MCINHKCKCFDCKKKGKCGSGNKNRCQSCKNGSKEISGCSGYVKR